MSPLWCPHCHQQESRRGEGQGGDRARGPPRLATRVEELGAAGMALWGVQQSQGEQHTRVRWDVTESECDPRLQSVPRTALGLWSAGVDG